MTPSSISLFSLLVVSLLLCCLNSLHAEYSIRFSHQAGQYQFSYLNVELNETLSAFGKDILFLESTEYVQLEESPLNLQISFVPSNPPVSINTTVEFEDGRWTYFVVTEPSGEVGDFIVLDDAEAPLQDWINFRVVYLSPLTNCDFYLDSVLLYPNLSYQNVTSIVQIPAGQHSIKIVDLKTEFSEEGLFTFSPGTGNTIVLNTGELGEVHAVHMVDTEFLYPTCEVRAINAVPEEDSEYVWVRLNSTEWFLEYASVENYQSIPVGEYSDVVFLTPEGSRLASTHFECESSGHYTIVLYGSPSSGVELSATVLDDANSAPLFSYTAVRVVHLSPSPSASPAQTLFDSIDVALLSCGQASKYVETSLTSLDIALIPLQTEEKLFQTTLTSQQYLNGYVYSLFVFGLEDSDDSKYGISSQFVSDFIQIEVPATTTTTGQSTTGDHDDDDDDDDGDDGYSAGQIAGIVIGVLLAVALVVVIVVFVIRKRSSGEKNEEHKDSLLFPGGL